MFLCFRLKLVLLERPIHERLRSSVRRAGDRPASDRSFAEAMPNVLQMAQVRVRLCSLLYSVQCTVQHDCFTLRAYCTMSCVLLRL